MHNKQRHKRICIIFRFTIPITNETVKGIDDATKNGNVYTVPVLFVYFAHDMLIKCLEANYNRKMLLKTNNSVTFIFNIIWQTKI